MFGPRSKKRKPVKKWHSRAMLIDLRKTRVIIARDETTITSENGCNTDTEFIPRAAENDDLNVDKSDENLAIWLRSLGLKFHSLLLKTRIL